MHLIFDGTVNLPFLAVILPMCVGLIWKASQLVEEFRNLRQDFNQHVEENEVEHKELRELALGRKMI